MDQPVQLEKDSVRANISSHLEAVAGQKVQPINVSTIPNQNAKNANTLVPEAIGFATIDYIRPE